MNNSEIFRFKIAVIGDGAVGKTSLIKGFTKGTFEKDYVKTIGAQLSKFNKTFNGDMIRLIFWDIAGQDDFNFLHHLFYKEAKAAIIVYSLETSELGKKSFIHITNWYNELTKYCGIIPVIIFANKVDLVNQDELNELEIQNLVKENNFLGYYITSAKTGQGVIEAFNAIIKKLYYKYKNLSSLE
ncbi:MAG: Rab family GTPase [Promethearchaeota archaeon]